MLSDATEKRHPYRFCENQADASLQRSSPPLSPPYAFLLLPPFLALDPVASAVSSGDAPAAANMAASSCSVYWDGVDSAAGAALALFGSRLPMTGTVEASMVWKGVATKRPAASNHSVKERDRLMVVGLPVRGVMVMVRL